VAMLVITEDTAWAPVKPLGLETVLPALPYT